MSSPTDLAIPGLTAATEIGTGGFATVYRAWQPAFRRAVAVKVLDISPDADTRARFERECQALGAVSAHPHIVGVHDAGFTATGRPYLVLELLPGGSLQDRVDQQGALPWDEATEIAVHLAGALETAHRAGVVHRDVKPGNVLVSAYGDPQLTDFGIARVVGAHETRSGVVTASMAHAAPEVLDGDRPTVAGDVYALASTTFELLAGRAPFTRPDDESVLPLLRRIMDGDLPDLRAVGVPDVVATAVEHGLARDAADRPPSAEAFGRILQAARRSLGLDPGRLVLARTALGDGAPTGLPVGGGVPAAPRPPVDAATTLDVPHRPGRNRPVVAGAAVVGGVGPTAGNRPVVDGGRRVPDNRSVAVSPSPISSSSGDSASASVARNDTVALAGRPAPRAPLAPRHVPERVAPPGRRSRVVAAAVVAVVVLAGAAWLGITRPGSSGSGGATPSSADVAAPVTLPPGYGADLARTFLEGCTANPANTPAFCRCVWDGITTSVPFEDYVAAVARPGDPRTDPVLGPVMARCDGAPPA